MPARLLLAFVLSLLCASAATAQPTYKLDAKRDLKPSATLNLADGKVTRSAVTDDPGYRLQFHFKKDGKTIATPEARSETSVALPATEPGTYSVTLELFYPSYKGGNQRKGEFKPISDAVTYKIETQKPLKVSVLRAEKKGLGGWWLVGGCW
jgi:hypothetical protein